jgi:hypothetical protein
MEKVIIYVYLLLAVLQSNAVITYSMAKTVNEILTKLITGPI